MRITPNNIQIIFEYYDNIDDELNEYMRKKRPLTAFSFKLDKNNKLESKIEDRITELIAKQYCNENECIALGTGSIYYYYRPNDSYSKLEYRVLKFYDVDTMNDYSYMNYIIDDINCTNMATMPNIVLTKTEYEFLKRKCLQIMKYEN